MKVVHTIHFRVFCERQEKGEVEKSLYELVLLGNPKPLIKETVAEGFDEKKIFILEASLEKTTFVNSFLKELKRGLREEDKQLLFHQAEQRVDEDLNFFLRFEKKSWMENERMILTEKGDCFHLKMNLAAYPKKREKGVLLVKEMFKR